MKGWSVALGIVAAVFFVVYMFSGWGDGTLWFILGVVFLIGAGVLWKAREQ